MSYGAAQALQAAVYQDLAAAPALAGVAIYDAVPPGPAGTFVLVGPEEVRDASDKTGQGAEHLLAISVISDAFGFQTAKAIAGAITDRLARSRRGESLSNRLRKAMRFTPAASNLLREADPDLAVRTPGALAALIKAVPITLTATQGLARAISTSGGVSLDALKGLELAQAPGVFVAGEMIDWEAPTGGYLLQASFATGRAAALALLKAGGDEPPVAWRPKVA